MHLPRALDPICLIQRRNNGGPPPWTSCFLLLSPTDLGPISAQKSSLAGTAAWREVSSFAEAAKNRHGRAVSGAINIPMARGGSLRCGRPQWWSKVGVRLTPDGRFIRTHESGSSCGGNPRSLESHIAVGDRSAAGTRRSKYVYNMLSIWCWLMWWCRRSPGRKLSREFWSPTFGKGGVHVGGARNHRVDDRMLRKAIPNYSQAFRGWEIHDLHPWLSAPIMCLKTCPSETLPVWRCFSLGM